jgi:dolichol-phosphate mannosyltransferase
VVLAAQPDGSIEPVTVIVPTYNERDNLPVLLERLQRALADAGRPFELLIVDDNSPDGTAQAAMALGPAVRTILRTDERGLATAVIRGLQEARYDLCVCMDADLSHPPEVVPTLIDKVTDGAPFALGSRYVDGGQTVDWSLLRWVNSVGATLLARPLTRVRDPMSGMFCCRRSAVPLSSLNPVGYKIALEILVKANISKPVEVPITFTDRLYGTSKMTVREQIAYLNHLVRLYRWRWPLLPELVLFCMVGCVGMVVDLAVLGALVEFLGVWFGWARIAGFLAAVSMNFVGNDRLTFIGEGKPPLLQRYGLFVVTSSLGMVVNYAVSMALFLYVPLFTELYPVAAVLGVVAGTAVNFTGARLVAFRRAPDAG